MNTEPAENPSYMPATSPGWATYYKRAKETRRLGKGQHANFQRASKRRRRQANVMLLASTLALALVVAAFFAFFGAERQPGPEGHNDAAPLLRAHTRRG